MAKRTDRGANSLHVLRMATDCKLSLTFICMLLQISHLCFCQRQQQLGGCPSWLVEQTCHWRLHALAHQPETIAGTVGTSNCLQFLGKSGWGWFAAHAAQRKQCHWTPQSSLDQHPASFWCPSWRVLGLLGCLWQRQCSAKISLC